MGELLAKRPSILIMSICSLYHIFYVGISDIACNEFTKRSTSAKLAPINLKFAHFAAQHMWMELDILRHGAYILTLLKAWEVHMAINIPFEQPVVLPPDPDDSAQQVAAAHAALQAGQGTASTYRERLNTIAALHPTCLNAWAALGELA